MQPRTRRQRDILEYIATFIARHGYEPSYAQIARHLGISSKATVAKHITALEKRGLIARARLNGSFTLNLREPEATQAESVYQVLCEVPLLGRIAAGAPLENFTDVNESIFVPRFMLGRVSPRQVYALRVVGDSMIEEHICDGDIALIENRTLARDGEIVVALIENDRATLKRIYRCGHEIELRPANSTLAPIRLPASSVTVQGIFRGLLRPAN